MDNNSKLRLYCVDVDYVRALHNADNKVEDSFPESHKENRAYVGVVIICNDKKYCIPLTSPKAKHQYMKNGVDFTKLIGRKGEPLGALNFNNMIPVDDSVIRKIDTNVKENDSIHDVKYKHLVADQIDWCDKNHDAIVKKANKLYRMITETPYKFEKLANRCCDFKMLEDVSHEYISQNYSNNNSNQNEYENEELDLTELTTQDRNRS